MSSDGWHEDFEDEVTPPEMHEWFGLDVEDFADEDFEDGLDDEGFFVGGDWIDDEGFPEDEAEFAQGIEDENDDFPW